MSDAQLQSLVRSQAETIAALRHQLDWFRRQVFGQKSERFAPEPDPAQMHLGELLSIPTPMPEKVKTIAAHTRRVVPKDAAHSGEELKFFDESKLPVESIVLVHGRKISPQGNLNSLARRSRTGSRSGRAAM